MIKRIAVKYVLLIVAVITLVTIIFVPMYIYVQKSMYINLEIQSMSDFCNEITQKLDFDDKDDIESYLEDNNEKSYTVIIYNSNRERLFTTMRYGRSDNTEYNRNATKISEKYINRYSYDSAPVYSEEDELERETIVLRRIVKDEGRTYYVYLRERLRNVESIFAYTNEVLVIVLILYIVVCGVFLFLLMMSLTRSIRSLNTAVKKISQKDYSVRYEGKFPNDEVGTLASNFNDMANTIQDNINSINNYNFLLKEDINHLRKYENMRRQFVRNTTHELKTPLAIISSQVEMMKCIEDEDKRNYYYESAMEEIQKMSDLITSFLNYSINENITFGDVTRINVSKKVNELCDKSASLMLTKKIKFSRNIEYGQWANIYEPHIEHIFNNFITNAVKHTKPGGRIEVLLKKSEKGCRLSVFNEGKKIKDSDLEKIWTEFFTTGGSDENVGLGLFIVKEIAEMYLTECGTMNKNNGVEFWFDIITE